MAYNLYLSLFTADLAANLPTAANVDNPKVARIFYATDTKATFFWNNSATQAWELQQQLSAVTVALLPTTNRIIGSLAFVSDATTPAIGSIVAGAGAVLAQVRWDGTNWRVV